jgi:glycosyltransferase involved in cell wall biosynthesis
MKSVVMVAYNFAPEGNAGAYRPLRFVRQLPFKGWKPTVLTLETDYYERYDPRLAELIPEEVSVIRVRNPDPWQAFQAKRSQRARKKFFTISKEGNAVVQGEHQSTLRQFLRTAVHSLETWCYHPDMAMTWIWPAVRTIARISSVAKPDIVWATAPPWSSFIVGALSARRLSVPYVLDFRDSWTLTYTNFERERPSWGKRLDRRILRKLFQGAAGVILRSETEAECFSRAYCGALESSKIHIIPNGFEGKVESCAVTRGEHCTVLYTGTLSDYRFDTILKGLKELKERHPECARQLRFHFVGEATEAVAREAIALGLTEIVITSEATSQDVLAKLSAKAHAFLLLERPASMRGHELLAGAKLFGYLKSGKPIIAVLPRCEARNILQRVGVTTIADADSVSEIVTILRRLFEAWTKDALPQLAPIAAACEAYSAERQTAALVRVFDGLPPAESFVLGSVDVPASLRKEIGTRGWINVPS